jgi:hypothetical protein
MTRLSQRHSQLTSQQVALSRYLANHLSSSPATETAASLRHSKLAATGVQSLCLRKTFLPGLALLAKMDNDSE